MKTALVFVGFGSDKGYDDSVFLKCGVEIGLKFTVFDVDSLRGIARVAFENSDGVIFVYKKETWSDLQKVMLIEFERSSVFVDEAVPYVLAKGFKKVQEGVFFDYAYDKPILFVSWDLKENIDFCAFLSHFASGRRIVKAFECDTRDDNTIYSDEVESIFLVEQKEIEKYKELKGVYTTNGQSPQEALFEVLKERERVKIATAESCTAGLVAARIADVPGVSDFLKGGAVTYSNKLKTNVLKVQPAILRSVGAVSEETAQSMAQGVINLTNADYSVAITGIAGPTGATKDKPVGLVYFGVASKNRVLVRKKVFSGNRRLVRDKSARYAILLLREFILNS